MKDLKTESVRWDLDIFYRGINDLQIDADLALYIEQMKAFNAAYKGKLDTRLGDAISAEMEISMLGNKVGAYVQLLSALNTSDAAVKAKLAHINRTASMAAGEYMTFFPLELAALPDDVIEKAMSNPVAKKHRPYIDHIRVRKPFMLSEEVESALAKRDPFGSGSWSEFFDELESDLEFDWRGEKKVLPQMLDIMSESPNSDERAEAMQIVNAGLSGMFAKYSAETLDKIVGGSAVERRERGYTHPMHERNLSNRTPDAVVEALHVAVTEVEAPLARRYYRLKAAHLGLKTLKWSDRNAPLPFEDTTVVPFNDAMKIVRAAYRSFSPTLAGLIEQCIRDKRIDAPMVKGKQGGAFNASLVLPGNVPTSWTFLNYLGSNRDVMTLAHELGHGVHGLLAGEAQGPLMSSAPIAFAETASVFGEMVTFNFLKEQLAEKGETKSLLALLMSKMSDMANTGLRQISFSNFERQLHGMDPHYKTWSDPTKKSVQELSALWKAVTTELYGKEGDVFTYENIDNLWAYIGHFHRPFYVYGYAFGELLTQSIYAKREELGTKFEPLYLDLLRAGSTKNAVDLLKPFGLDPTDEKFWIDGIAMSFGKAIEEAEALSKEMGVSI
ncbi:M3 family oligoendopeptidase [Candidatus Kaiserbacteria bacterium]|nr:M3 family oligoendopeptidase [Candidatus Kaiserbacteria bacterium]